MLWATFNELALLHDITLFLVSTGDRIAQLILEKIITPEILEVPELDPTLRGSGGFGSTGKN